MGLWSYFACLVFPWNAQSSEKKSPMPTQNPALSSHTRQVPSRENTSSASPSTMPISNKYQKPKTMRLQHPDHANGKVVKVRAIHHFVRSDDGKRFSTAEVELQLDDGRTKHTTLRHSEVKDMEGGKAELDKFGSHITDPVL